MANVLGEIFQNRHGTAVPPAPVMGESITNEAADYLPKDTNIDNLSEYNKNFDELKSALNKLDAVLASAHPEQAAPEVARLLNQIASINLPQEIKNRELGRHSTQAQSEVKEALKSNGPVHTTKAHQAAQAAINNYMIAERMTAAAAFESYRLAAAEFDRAPLTKESIERFNRRTADDIERYKKEHELRLAEANKLSGQEKKDYLLKLEQEDKELIAKLEAEKKVEQAKRATLDSNSEEYKKSLIKEAGLNSRISAARDAFKITQIQLKEFSKQTEQQEGAIQSQTSEDVKAKNAGTHEKRFAKNNDANRIVSQEVSMQASTDTLLAAQKLKSSFQQQGIETPIENKSLDDSLADLDALLAPNKTTSQNGSLVGAPVPDAPPLNKENTPNSQLASGKAVSAPERPGEPKGTEDVFEPNITSHTTKSIALGGATRVEVEDTNADALDINLQLLKQFQHNV